MVAFGPSPFSRNIPPAPGDIDAAGDDCFSFEHACRLASQALGHSGDRTVVIDLGGAADATTAAFARLVELRRTLLRAGRDLLLTGLRGRAAHVYEVNRLGGVLPRQ